MNLARRPLRENRNVAPRVATRKAFKTVPKTKPQDLAPQLEVCSIKAEEPIDEFTVKRDVFRKQLVDSKKISSSTLNEADLDMINDVTMSATYAQLITDYLQEREQSTLPLQENFISDKSELTPRNRYIAVDWMVAVWHKFKLSSDALYLAVSIMDRFIQKTSEGLTNNNIQRVAITSLFIASKIDESCCPALSDFSFVTSGSSTSRAILYLEMGILETLNFQITLPKPLFFLKRYIHLAKSPDKVIFLSKYLLFLTLPEYDLCHLSGNVRAAAAIVLANSLLVTKSSDLSQSWSTLLSWHSGLSICDLLQPIKILARTVVRQNSPSHFRAVQTVFSGSNYNSIARIPELYGEIIYLIAEVD